MKIIAENELSTIFSCSFHLSSSITCCRYVIYLSLSAPPSLIYLSIYSGNVHRLYSHTIFLLLYLSNILSCMHLASFSLSIYPQQHLRLMYLCINPSQLSSFQCMSLSLLLKKRKKKRRRKAYSFVNAKIIEDGR